MFWSAPIIHRDLHEKLRLKTSAGSRAGSSSKEFGKGKGSSEFKRGTSLGALSPRIYGLTEKMFMDMTVLSTKVAEEGNDDGDEEDYADGGGSRS